MMHPDVTRVAACWVLVRLDQQRQLSTHGRHWPNRDLTPASD